MEIDLASKRIAAGAKALLMYFGLTTFLQLETITTAESLPKSIDTKDLQRYFIADDNFLYLLEKDSRKFDEFFKDVTGVTLNIFVKCKISRYMFTFTNGMPAVMKRGAHSG